MGYYQFIFDGIISLLAFAVAVRIVFFIACYFVGKHDQKVSDEIFEKADWNTTKGIDYRH